MNTGNITAVSISAIIRNKKAIDFKLTSAEVRRMNLWASTSMIGWTKEMPKMNFANPKSGIHCE